MDGADDGSEKRKGKAVLGMKLINPEIRVETSNLCNAKCIVCPREKMTRKKCIMGDKHFRELVGQAKELGATGISPFGYGEPLLDEHLWVKLIYCGGFHTNITTNASLLDPDTSRILLASGLKQIRFSAHGMGANYERVHKRLRWMEFIANVSEFIRINNDVFGHSCTTEVSVIPMHGESVQQIVDFWKPMVDFLEVWRPHNWTDGKDFRPTARKKKTCGRPFRGPVQIQSDGKMIVCCFDYDGKLTVGDTHKNSIEEILKGDRFNEIREAHTTGKLDGLICQKCDQLNIEEHSPLLYSNRDPEMKAGKTSSTKFNLEG